MFGWFLIGNSRRKKASRAGRAGTKGAWVGRLTPAHLRSAVNILGWLLLVGLVAGGWTYGQPYLRDAVAERHSQPPTIALVNYPIWLEDYFKDQIARAALTQLSDDPFDHDALTAAARAVAVSPWVRRVEKVVRRPDGMVEVHAEYRVPHALIQHGGRFHPVDQDGVRLPVEFSRAEAARRRLILITGIESPPPQPGEVWPGEDVGHALLLARLIHGRSWASEVAGIDTSNDGGRLDGRVPELKLVTALDDDNDPTNNPGLFWGRPPGHELFYEPRPAVKLAHIERLRERYGSIDAGGRIADVSADQVLLHPIAGAELRAASSALGYTADRGSN